MKQILQHININTITIYQYSENRGNKNKSIPSVMTARGSKLEARGCSSELNAPSNSFWHLLQNQVNVSFRFAKLENREDVWVKRQGQKNK